MYYNISIPAYSIKKESTYYITTPKHDSFPFLTIGKDSYIVNATIGSGIDFDWESGIHSLQIGKYTSLADNILFMINMNHDYKSVSLGCISGITNKNSTNIESKLHRKGHIIIENDVWIGRGATIMSGVTIHNGAVVATNAVVTKDVPPYAIVAGNPARIVKYRFTEKQISELLNIAWWDWTQDEIIEAKDYLFNNNINNFINKYKSKNIFTPSPIMDKLTTGKRFLYFLDLSAPYPLYQKVIHWFAVNHHGTSNELLLIGDKNDPKYNNNFPKLLNTLSSYENYDIYINIYDETLNSDIDAICCSDYYLTNRLEKNIYRMCKAELHNVKIIFSVDSPIAIS